MRMNVQTTSCDLSWNGGCRLMGGTTKESGRLTVGLHNGLRRVIYVVGWQKERSARRR